MSKKRSSKTVTCDLSAADVHTITTPVAPETVPPLAVDPDQAARNARRGYPVGEAVLDWEAAHRAAAVAVVESRRPDVAAAQAAANRYAEKTYGHTLTESALRAAFAQMQTWKK